MPALTLTDAALQDQPLIAYRAVLVQHGFDLSRPISAECTSTGVRFTQSGGWRPYARSFAAWCLVYGTDRAEG